MRAGGRCGLHSRRHDAELRLKAAEDNLARIGDVLGGLNSQMDSLKRQARQARRYRELSGEIRSAEALAFHLAWLAAQADVETGEGALREALLKLAAATEDEARALAEESELADTLPPLREAEALKGTIAARLRIELDQFDKEAERLQRRRAELEGRIAHIDRDLAREDGLAVEARETAERLAEEAALLDEEKEQDADRDIELERALEQSTGRLRSAEQALSELTRRTIETKARRDNLERGLAERQQRLTKTRADLDRLAGERRTASAGAPDAAQRSAAEERHASLSATIAEIEAQTLAAEEAIEQLGEASTAARAASDSARREADRIATEIATLEKVLSPLGGRNLPPIVDQVTVAPGLEMALVAALGEDLDAPVEEAAAMHWRLVEATGADPDLPGGAEPLSIQVTGPPELRRRLRQVGVVAREQGRSLQAELKAGQRLVSREGDLWRWDGFVATSEAPSPAAIRLAERNRLTKLGAQAKKLAREAEMRADEAGRAATRLAAGEGEARRLRQLWRDTQLEQTRARDALAAIERQAREVEARLLSLDEATARLKAAAEALDTEIVEAETALDMLAADDGLDDALATAEQQAQAARAEHAACRERTQALARERKARQDRHEALVREARRWQARASDTDLQLKALRERRAEAEGELQGLADLPETLAERRAELMDAHEEAERERREAADRYAAAESAMKRVAQTLRLVQAAVSEAREARARNEAHLEGARTRRAEEGRRIREALDCPPEDCLKLAALSPGAPLPAQADVERQLVRLKSERDRLGGVNLSADDELSKLSEEHGRLDAERADVEQAVAKLRGAIGQLNREAKKRLGEAFQTVNGHFQRLFGTLFGGGEARLEMIESEEDPLEGGLEIIAKPPGKKPATLSLLSGGEQTLTALSLIFAVFLTNPSPICVLDEVDAPLDDSNVDRFCTLMESMAAETDTRFLVITHHPMTMARMNRLFGVTMAEKGVSQLVSVDLATAERIIEDDDAEAARGAA